MARDEKEVVSALRKVLAGKVGHERYVLWFGQRTRFAWDGLQLTLGVVNSFYLDWIRTVFHDAIEEACQAVLGSVPPIRYELFQDLNAFGADQDVVVSRSRQGKARNRSTTRRIKNEGHKPTPPGDESTWQQLPLFAGLSETGSGPRGNGSHSAESGAASISCKTRGPTFVQNAQTPERKNDIQLLLAAETTENSFDEGASPSNVLAGAKGTISTEHRPGLNPACPIALRVINDDLAERDGEVLADLNVEEEEEPEGECGPRLQTAQCVSSAHVSCNSHEKREEERLRGRRFGDLATFVVGDCNRLAYAAAETVSRSLGTYSPLLIHGPSGVGKTHLLESIWKAVKKRNPRIPAWYLSAEQFTSAYVEALQTGTIPVFRQKYRGVQLLILDDLQFFAGKRQTQIELLYTLDTLLKNGCQVVCAADRPPSELRELTPELRSRLEGGIICRIDPPDLATRRKIVETLCQGMNFALAQDVQEWVAESFARNVRQLIGALRRLEAASRALRKPLDRSLAGEILSDLLPEGTKQVTLADVEREVCRVFALPPGTLQSDRKDRSVTYPRMLAMWLARKCTRANLSEIGRFFGKRSHATVISAQKRVEEWLSGKQDTNFSESHRTLRETLQEIERRLRAG